MIPSRVRLVSRVAAVLVTAAALCAPAPARAGGLLGGGLLGGGVAAGRYAPQVVVKQAVGSLLAPVWNLLGVLGWKVTWSYGPAQLTVARPGGFLAAPIGTVLQLLAAVPGVQAVEKDVLFTVDDPYGGKQSQAPLFNDDLVQASVATQPAMQTIEIAGPGTAPAAPLVAVIDGGFDLRHESLASANLAPGYDAIDGGDDVNDAGNGLDDDGNGTVDGGVGHGTAVAALVAAVCPGARVMPIRALDDEGIATVGALAAGVDWAMRAGATVINISAGASSRSAVLENVLAAASARGVVVVAAAGNGDGGPVCYPGTSRYATCVAGVTADRQVDDASSRGAEVDVAAPSVDVVAPFPRTTNGYGRWHGTSFAAPLFAGGLAQQMVARPGMTAPAGLQALLSTLTPHDPSIVAQYGNTLGAGVVDVRRALSR